MKREEKNQLSRQRILDYAMREFGDKGYAEASLNAICAAGNISKGIIYHYFQDKDALYLACVEACFDSLTAHLSRLSVPDTLSLQDGVQAYFDMRSSFFAEHPHCHGVFVGAVCLPPPHLSEKIQMIRREFDAVGVSILTAQLQKEQLREGLSVEEVIFFLRSYQNFFNAQQAALSDRTQMQEQEPLRRRAIEMLLYGVLDQKNDWTEGSGSRI